MKNDSCSFCNLEDGDHILIKSSANFWLIKGKYGVSKAHYLIIPKVHYETIFDMDGNHWNEFGELLTFAKSIIDTGYHPDGYNIGWNVCAAGGQTINHAHCHIIDRYTGDVKNPKGGIRWVLPDKADYTKEIEREKLKNERK